MLRHQWTHLDIKTIDDLYQVQAIWKSTLSKNTAIIGAMDTETTGLHIILDKPFILVFGWLDSTSNRGYTFAVDILITPQLAKQTMQVWHELSSSLTILLGHNLKFDLHMLYNVGYDFSKHQNLGDTQHYIRFAHDSLQPGEGGPPLGLKDYTYRYITAEAKAYDRYVQQERGEKAKFYNLQLKNKLGVSLKTLKEIFADPTSDASDLPEHLKEPYQDWLHSLPLYLQHIVLSVVETDMIRYTDVRRELVMKYAHYDVKYTLEIYAQTHHVIEARKQQKGLEIENKLIPAFFNMERTGFKIDRDYLETARQKMKAYIRERRQVFIELAGEEVTVGQHARIKELLQTKFEVDVTSSGSGELDLLKNKLDPVSPGAQFISILQELRTLEKWYSAYITRFQKDLKFTDRLYTQIHSVGTVSGRVTSDFQQFPKDAIKTITGEEIFHPRKMVITDHQLVYLDYSQIELRVQAFYTMLVGHPDLNMCRAYMPYKCIERDGKFYLEEDISTLWHEVDIHGATTEKATGLKPEDPNFSKLRSIIGKRVNFAKNYGAQLGKIREMFPDKTLAECQRINDAYYAAFPGVKEYHKYCERIAAAQAAVPNLFGVYYYNCSGHKLKNMLVQGSAAYLLKLKILEIDEYLKDKHTKVQMQIHDELSFEYDPRDPFTIFDDIKHIMEDWPDCPIPIVAEADTTTTNWGEKHEL